MKKSIRKLLVSIARKHAFLRESVMGFITFVQKRKYMKFYRKYKVDDNVIAEKNPADVESLKGMT